MSFTHGTIVISRPDALAFVIKRDGDFCVYPGCKHPTIFTEDNPRTLDHDTARANGGSDDVSNLRLMHQKCNNVKGDRLWIIDETGQRVLEPLPFREPKSAVVKRPPNDCCFEGRALVFGEICPTCGSGPQPVTFPNYAKRNPKDCNHSSTHCWYCILGFVERTPASADVFGVD